MTPPPNSAVQYGAPRSRGIPRYRSRYAKFVPRYSTDPVHVATYCCLKNVDLCKPAALYTTYVSYVKLNLQFNLVMKPKTKVLAKETLRHLAYGIQVLRKHSSAKILLNICHTDKYFEAHVCHEACQALLMQNVHCS